MLRKLQKSDETDKLPNVVGSGGCMVTDSTLSILSRTLATKSRSTLSLVCTRP